MRGQQAITIQDSYTPSSYYRFMIPGVQKVGSGRALDISGQGRHATLDTGLPDDGTGIWANDGSITTKQGAVGGGGVRIGGATAVGANHAMPWNANAEHSMILAVMFKCPVYATLGSGGGIFGCVASDSVSGYGLGESSTGSGGLGFSLRGAGGFYEAGLRNLINITDAKWHLFLALVNGNLSELANVDTPKRTARLFLDGKEVTSQMTDAGSFLTTTFGSNTIPTQALSMGHNGDPGASGTIGIQTGKAHGLLLPAGKFPSNGKAVAAHYFACPGKLLPAAVLGG